MENILIQIDGLIEGSVQHRPSKHCRSPYVADVSVGDNNVIAHAPSLGCCGYADSGACVMIKENEGIKTKVCTHTLYLSKVVEKGHEYIVGIHPKIAERIVEKLIEGNYIPTLQNSTQIEREKTYLNSRFDFTGTDENGRKFILEVKNSPCADYEDISHKERKGKDYTSWSYDSKIAYFPDGYRKNVKDTVSPRALKHIQELEKIKLENEGIRTIIVYIIQRSDIVHFQPSNIDMIYKNAVKQAFENGVEIFPISVVWDEDGRCRFNKVLPLKF